MAIKLFDAVGFLRTDASAMRRGLEKARGSAKTVLGKVGTAFKSFAKLAVKTFAIVGAAITGAVVAGLVQFAKLEKGVSEITTLFGRIGAEAPALKRELGGILSTLMTEFGQDLPDAIKGTYDAVSAGIRRADVGGFMKTAARLAVLGVTNIAKSVDVLTSLINSYGLSADDAQAVSDHLFTTVRRGKTTMEELAQSMGQIAPIAAGANVSLREMLSAMAVLTSRGLSTAEAATALKAAIQSMLKPTGEAVELAEKLGIDWDANALSAKGLKGMMESLATATGGNASEMAELVGSVRGLNAALILTSEEGAKSFAVVVDEMHKDTGVSAEAFKEMADTVDFQFKRMKGAIKTAFSGIGSIFAESFKGFLTETNEWLGKNSNLFDRFRTAVKEKMDAAGIDLKKTWTEKVLPAIERGLLRVVQAMEDWANGTGDIQDALDAFSNSNFLLAVRTIIGTVKDLFKVLLSVSAQLRTIQALFGWLASGSLNAPRVPIDIPTNSLPDPFSISGRQRGGDTNTTNNNIGGVEIKIDGSDVEAETLANMVGEAILNLGRANQLTRGGIAVQP